MNQLNLQTRILVTGLCFAAASVAASLQAQSINFDLKSVPDSSYGPAPGVYGSAGSVWNEVSRSSSANVLALVDDAGASSSVTVSYVRSNSYGASSTGTYANLGTSHVATGAVTLDGLTPGALYDLVIYNASVIGGGGIATTTPSFTVGAATKTATGGSDWNTLTAGVNYVEFTDVAATGGSLSFTPIATNPLWSGFQIRPSAAVPEPSTYGLIVGAGLIGFAAVRRVRR